MKMNTNMPDGLSLLAFSKTGKRERRMKGREKKDCDRNPGSRVADTRNIVTSLSWLTFNFQA